MRKLQYRGAGTIEFLYEDGEFYFIEMNTRLQVEHPVTETITGIDLVSEQIRIAAGEPLSVTPGGYRFEATPSKCRINAEDPQTFAPSPGPITHLPPAGRPGRPRRFRALYEGYKIPPYYDTLIGKLIVYGRTREECLMRLRRALDEFVVDGIKTTLPLFQRPIREPDIIAATTTSTGSRSWPRPAPREELMTAVDDVLIEITPQVLLKAYACGIFPMAESAEDHALYWIEPERAASCRSTGSMCRNGLRTSPRRLRGEVDRTFDAVIAGCAAPRSGRRRPGSTIASGASMANCSRSASATRSKPGRTARSSAGCTACGSAAPSSARACSPACATRARPRSAISWRG